MGEGGGLKLRIFDSYVGIFSSFFLIKMLKLSTFLFKKCEVPTSFAHFLTSNSIFLKKNLIEQGVFHSSFGSVLLLIFTRNFYRIKISPEVCQVFQILDLSNMHSTDYVELSMITNFQNFVAPSILKLDKIFNKIEFLENSNEFHLPASILRIIRIPSSFTIIPSIQRAVNPSYMT